MIDIVIYDVVKVRKGINKYIANLTELVKFIDKMTPMFMEVLYPAISELFVEIIYKFIKAIVLKYRRHYSCNHINKVK